MRLSFEYTKTAGAGLSPQAVHMMDNGLRFIYLSVDGLVEARECFPDMGLYDALNYTDKGRISADFEASRPQLKKVAHHGAYGFWSSEDAHRFVIYMLPYDVSTALVDGSISLTKDSPVSQLSISFMNIGGGLVGRYRSVISPNTMLEIGFTMGGSAWLPLGQFYIDRVSTSYPDESISVSARNSIGKLLKEQTFDENNSFLNATLKENLEAILQLSGIESYFVGDSQKVWKLTFEPDTALQGALKRLFPYFPDGSFVKIPMGRSASLQSPTAVLSSPRFMCSSVTRPALATMWNTRTRTPAPSCAYFARSPPRPFMLRSRRTSGGFPRKTKRCMSPCRRGRVALSLRHMRRSFQS